MLSNLIGLGALLAYSVIWYGVLVGGGQAQFTAQFGSFERYIEPWVIGLFIVLVTASAVKQIIEWGDR